MSPSRQMTKSFGPTRKVPVIPMAQYMAVELSMPLKSYAVAIALVGSVVAI